MRLPIRDAAKAILFSGVLFLVVLPELQAQKPQPAQTDYVVLSSKANTSETERSCSSGGGFLTGLCEGMKSRPISRTFHTAIVTDADGVYGYLVQCEERSGLLAPKCDPLTAGQKLRGYIQSGKLILQVDGKTRTYRIVKSAHNPEPATKPNGAAEKMP